MHVAPVLHVLSLVIMLFAGCMLVPLGESIGFDDAAQRACGIAVPVTFACGAAPPRPSRRSRTATRAPAE